MKAGLLDSAGQQLPLQAVHVKCKLIDLLSQVNESYSLTAQWFYGGFKSEVLDIYNLTVAVFSRPGKSWKPVLSSLLVFQVIIFQKYTNTSSVPIEAKYVFPLDDSAAVCGFEAFINGKHVVGQVTCCCSLILLTHRVLFLLFLSANLMYKHNNLSLFLCLCGFQVKEKETARREYKQAIERGHGAYLMDQDAPVRPVHLTKHSSFIAQHFMDICACYKPVFMVKEMEMKVCGFGFPAGRVHHQCG